MTSFNMRVLYKTYEGANLVDYGLGVESIFQGMLKADANFEELLRHENEVSKAYRKEVCLPGHAISGQSSGTTQIVQAFLNRGQFALLQMERFEENMRYVPVRDRPWIYEAMLKELQKAYYYLKVYADSCQEVRELREKISSAHDTELDWNVRCERGSLLSDDTATESDDERRSQRKRKFKVKNRKRVWDNGAK